MSDQASLSGYSGLIWLSICLQSGYDWKNKMCIDFQQLLREDSFFETVCSIKHSKFCCQLLQYVTKYKMCHY